jgi:uncharacterized membrane protein YgcG
MFLRKIFFVLFSILFYQVQAQEKILDFDVKIQIEKSGTIQVIENITINAEGNVFRHGLLRVFPLVRQDKDGNNIDVEYSINSIKKDGIDEQYFTKAEDNEWKVYIGDKDIYLQPGIYKYQINYSVPFQIGYFDHYDELYWNVTGNGWDFPIDKATCQLYLPGENKFQNLHCYTGTNGSTTSNCISSLNFNNTVVTFSAVHLNANEGLTAAASFPKGIVDEPTFAEKWSSFYKQIKIYLWLFIFGAGMLFSFFYWRKRKKNRVNETIIPEFLPPFDWSPAIVGYVYHGENNNKTYMSSLINAAVKGAVKISSSVKSGVFSDDTKYEIEVLDKDLKYLSAEESDVISSFSKKAKIKVEDNNYRIFAAAYSKWTKTLSNLINLEDFYQNNTRKKWIGFAVLVIAGLVYEVLANRGSMNNIFYVVLILIVSGLTYWFSNEEEQSGLKILRGILAFFIYPMAFFIFLFTLFFLSTVDFIIIGFIVLSYIVYVINLEKLTANGCDAIARLEGFKLYLETAEKDRMNMLNPPELTPQLFEKLLPYAIALGVEIKWGKQFEEVLELAKYNPDWYQGDDTFYRQPAVFVSGFGNSVNSARVDPSPPSSSNSSSSSSSGSSGSSGSWSSGSSGSGSSGGGGGGGGGGGW